ncbi:uncharacterized protein LOC114384416 [Glycine soja]|uniref:Plant bHLH transcription factor ACT-like domain-containing protein n=2 Tax=Glycine soja TaxID=3848 RepID=A0A0B2PMS1_GLYSO|nr:uncharacterized protein LOC114384416 [Glycine soja]KHN08842.1 hypothetical protein glysoja_044024 [Glycine soja]RZB69918.1 hypothetical protein D0Y65_039302 [Glycine soja]
MVSRVHKRTALYRSIQQLRSITNSHARRKTSVILDASKYIRGLKQKLQELNQLAVAAAQKDIEYGPVMPMLKVEPQEEGFMIKVLSQRSCQGLLAFILEAFERLGLEVLQARASCVESFSLEAFGIKEKNDDTHRVDAQVVEQVVSRAINDWRKVTKQC